jgi:CubicO group peptidase (beta-lactamase class C family)
MRRLPLPACLTATYAAFAVLSGGALANDWPTKGWKVATPESAGLDSGKLAEALIHIRNATPNAHGIFLEMNGKAVLDTSFYPYDGSETHNLASVTKSVVTTLIAIAAGQGKLRLDQPVLDFFKDRKIANRDERKERITVRHLTGMVSGLACVGEHDEPTLHEMNASADWVQFALDLKMVAEPGTTFSYCSPGMHLLSAILQKATGQTALDFARQNLFQPLGITESDWPADPQGITHGWGDLRLYARDAAKIGYLWLNNGQWDGRQIVSPEWVKASASFQIATGSYWGDDYGLGWWIDREQDIPHYAAAGRGGQSINVYPSLGVVAVTVAGGIDPGELTDELGKALVSPGQALPANPQGMAKLEAALRQIAEPPAPVAPAPLPAMARQISGKTYVFEPNALSMSSLTLTFGPADVAEFVMTFSGTMPELRGNVGLDGIYRFFPAEDGIRAGMRGGWVSPNGFRAEFDGIANIDAFDLDMQFDRNTLVMIAKDRTYEKGVRLVGKSN